MNKRTNGQRSSQGTWWTDRRVICIALILLAAVYVAVEPRLEKMLGIELPNLVERDEDKDKNKDDSGKDRKVSPDFKIDPSVLNGKSKSDGGKSTPNNSKNSNNGSSSDGFKLTDAGRDSYKSPAGLLYTMGPRREHRIEHVMRHAEDQPTRGGPHGVFNASSQTDVLKLLDKAYTMIKTNARGVNKKGGDRNDEYTIDMPNVIGYVGGQAGAKSGKPKTKRMKLILDGNRVITAYPTWPPRGRR